MFQALHVQVHLMGKADSGHFHHEEELSACNTLGLAKKSTSA